MSLVYQIGHEILNGQTGAKAVQSAIRSQPTCAIEVLIAGVTEILETRNDAAGVAEAIKALQVAAKEVDRRSQSAGAPPVGAAERRARHQ